MAWFLVVDAQGFIHSVWGSALKADSEQAAKKLSDNFGWAGIRAVEYQGERPHVGQQIKAFNLCR